MNILGLSAFYHDSAACLLKNGLVVAAAQEERFTRQKHDHRFPALAIGYCLRQGSIDARQIDAVCFYDKPFIKFERLLKTYLTYAPFGFRSFIKAMPLWLKEKLFLDSVIKRHLPISCPIYFTEHHEAHGASAFFPSPFESAAILTLDGVGEWATASLAHGKGNQIETLQEIHFPHSLGLLYSAFTYYTGFRVNSGEYKVMGLAPYGEPKYAEIILTRLMDLKEDGSFKLDLKYFDYPAGLTMTTPAFHKLFGGPPRTPESQITQKEMDLAASVQQATEEVVLRMARHARKTTGERYLCLAGGVALNCVANGLVLRKKIFDELWIQPAAGDAGGALGAALAIWHQALKQPRYPQPYGTSLLGPDTDNADIASFLNGHQIPHHALTDAQLYQRVSADLATGKVVGWFRGRMEFGPRALGARSILGDARSPQMQSIMNLKIKNRESFRPFAPAILEEHAEEYFELDCPSPYMLLVAPVKPQHRIAMTEEQKKLFGIAKLNVPRSDVPAITHVDYSARIQTVAKNDGAFRQLLETFYQKTGCPLLINTSFNVRGEPIVCSPEDAYRCFRQTAMDVLVLGNYLLYKTEQDGVAQELVKQRVVRELD